MREVKRQCRTLRISDEQNTSVRIADHSPLLSWLPRFAAQVMNKMRIDKDGKTSEMRRIVRRWRKLMAQFGEKVWFGKMGEDGVNSFASRMTLGIFVGHHEQFCAFPRMELCEAKELSDAWESTNWEFLCGTPWQMVAPETEVDEESHSWQRRSGTQCQGLWLKGNTRS